MIEMPINIVSEKDSGDCIDEILDEKSLSY